MSEQNNALTPERIIEIFKEVKPEWTGDNALQGLKILEKYADNSVLCGANHDEIYSIDFEDAIKNGITEEDVRRLALLNWCAADGSYFACYV